MDAAALVLTPPRAVTAVAAPVLALRRASRFYANGRGLAPIDLKLRAGRFVALVGASGAGKSTLLRLLAGLDRPSGGEVLLDGAPRRPARRGDTAVALIFQRPHLVGRMRVVDNVLGGRLGNLPRWRGLIGRFTDADWALALECLDQVGLLEHANERTDRLSGGEQQRVAIARALVQQPRALLADEPVASLDPDNARRVLSLLRGCADRGLAVLASLHQPDLARAFADQTVALGAAQVALTPRAGSLAA
jgi:phosphonate transport system ATP-binding protein